MTTEHGRPDAADDMVGEIVGAARPVVDSAIDQAALLALDATLRMADDLRDNFPGVPHDYDSATTSLGYMAGWDEALMELVRRVRAARNRIQQYHEDKAAADVATH